MTQTKKSFNETITTLLNEKLSKYKRSKLDYSTCTNIYVDIFNAFTEILSQVNTGLSNESVNYIAQQYYDSVRINGHQELDPKIFEKRAYLYTIPTNELGLLAVMLRDTDFVYPIIQELKKRS
jgi:hypothetical protein